LALFISPAGQPFRAAVGATYPVAAWFAQADRDHDGKITREEFRADFEAFFRTLDTNHDGIVDGFETTDYEQKIVPEILSDFDERSFAQGAPALARSKLQGAAPYSLTDLPEPVSDADADFDSKITLPEFLAAADRRFDGLDAKHLGYLTLDDLPRTPVQILIEGRNPKAK
jgi:hypothetical protein